MIWFLAESETCLMFHPNRLEPTQRFTKRDEKNALGSESLHFAKGNSSCFFPTFTDVSIIQFLFYCSSPGFAVKT